MMLREVRSTGVGWVVDEDGPGLTVNKALHFLEIDFPRLLRLQKNSSSQHNRKVKNNNNKLTKRL